MTVASKVLLSTISVLIATAAVVNAQVNGKTIYNNKRVQVLNETKKFSFLTCFFSCLVSLIIKVLAVSPMDRILCLRATFPCSLISTVRPRVPRANHCSWPFGKMRMERQTHWILYNRSIPPLPKRPRTARTKSA